MGAGKIPHLPAPVKWKRMVSQSNVQMVWNLSMLPVLGMTGTFWEGKQIKKKSTHKKAVPLFKDTRISTS